MPAASDRKTRSWHMAHTFFRLSRCVSACVCCSVSVSLCVVACVRSARSCCSSVSTAVRSPRSVDRDWVSEASADLVSESWLSRLANSARSYAHTHTHTHTHTSMCFHGHTFRPCCSGSHAKDMSTCQGQAVYVCVCRMDQACYLIQGCLHSLDIPVHLSTRRLRIIQLQPPLTQPFLHLTPLLLCTGQACLCALSLSLHGLILVLQGCHLGLCALQVCVKLS